MGIRMATAADTAELLAIYGQYINTSITFEYTLPSEETFSARITGILAEYPYLVWQEEGKILSTLWLDLADGTPLRGEIAVDGEIILTAEFTSFAFCDTIDPIS